MSTLDIARSDSREVSIHPLAAAGLGAVAFGAAMTAGEVFDLNADTTDVTPVSMGEIALYVALVGAAVALASWLGVRALARGPQALQRTAMGLAIGSVLTFVVFWSGWPMVLGAVATALPFAYRRRVGSFSPAVVVSACAGALSFLAAAVVCVVG
ncbi:hypothetical protein [Knoellia sp. Soil729]|uniref:hypothetical protein n=1 Tax=Knoellia sp. Soil729 TaxID=1736394 RepID=UPI0006F4CFBA|nr:hypothetical protein [Knoellia sp. Soil729]KRE42165.1 hypothetical protein ASG74_06805 [Knoellia sp. Soil729]